MKIQYADPKLTGDPEICHYQKIHNLTQFLQDLVKMTGLLGGHFDQVSKNWTKIENFLTLVYFLAKNEQNK